MADAKIDFNDGAAATLQSSRPQWANRFANWTPFVDDIGWTDVAVGTGLTIKQVLRTDYGATFEVPYLTQDKFAVAMRLKRHLTNGGSVTVTTADKDGATYTAILRPEKVPEIRLVNRITMEYTMMLELVNSGGSVMTVNYAA